MESFNVHHEYERKSNMRLLISCTATLLMLYVSVFASQSYAQEHPMDGLQLKMMYCMEMQREEDRALEDIGCKVGQGVGKVGVKKHIIRQLVERIDMNKQSFEYVQLVSSEGLVVWFKEDSLGSKGKVVVWQNADTGRMKIQVCKEN